PAPDSRRHRSLLHPSPSRRRHRPNRSTSQRIDLSCRSQHGWPTKCCRLPGRHLENVTAERKRRRHISTFLVRDPGSRRGKVFYGWWVVSTAGLGLGLGYAPIIVYSFGIFV